MFCFYKRRCRDKFLSECAISHCRKGVCALPANEDSNYLTPMPLDNQCCLVRGGECVDTKSKDRSPLQAFGKQSYQHRKSEMSFQNQIWSG